MLLIQHVRISFVRAICLPQATLGQLSCFHQPLPMRETIESRSRSPQLFLAGAAATLPGAVWLWVYFGATLFFETIRGGFVACFG